MRKKPTKQTGAPAVVLQRVVIRPGQRIIVTGDHPWSGELGEYVRDQQIPFGLRALVQLENGTDCFVKHEQMKAV